MMETTKVAHNAFKILRFIKTTDMKPDEATAALESAKAIIQAAVSAETWKLMMANWLTGGK